MLHAAIACFKGHGEQHCAALCSREYKNLHLPVPPILADEQGGAARKAANTAFLHNFLRNVESNNKREITKNAARAAHQVCGDL